MSGIPTGSLPVPCILASIPIGYYTGGHLRTADVDINHDHAAADPAIAETAAWLNGRSDLFLLHAFKHREVQITIDMDKLRDPYRFPADLEQCAPFADGRVRVTGSGHSYDIVPATRSEEHTSELQSLMRISYAVFCLKKKNKHNSIH